MADENMLTRRGLFMKLGILFNGLVAAALTVPVLGYVLSALTRGRGNAYFEWVSLGKASEFPEGETRLATFRNPNVMPADGKTVDTACWVRRIEGDQFQVFAINCAHLGCPVRWFSESQLFMCPCHGGIYYADGSRASGPPERGLFTYELKVDNGKLLIRAGQTPTLRNRASASPCPSLETPDSPKLVSRIESCPGSKSRGINASTIG